MAKQKDQETLNTQLYNALLKSDPDIVQKRIDEGADVNCLMPYDGFGSMTIQVTPLMLAAYKQKAKFIDILLDNGANADVVGKYNKSALDIVLDMRNIDRHGAEAIAKHMSVVDSGLLSRIVCYKDFMHNADTTLLQILVDNNVNINIKDEKGWSPLHYAVDSYGNLTNVKVLLRHGVDVNAQTNEGLTPLHLALRKKYHDTMIELDAAGADKEIKDKEGLTPLAYGVKYDTYFNQKESFTSNLIIDFVKLGANPNAQDNNGDTPLHWAFGNNNICSVRSLLMVGADISVKNNKGQKPFETELRVQR